MQVPATWHWSEAAQTTGLPLTQLPAWQASVWVQALPSLQAAPSAAAGFVQVPVDGTHVPATWHWSDAVQTTGVPARQTPPLHVSPSVHPLPSSHGPVLFVWTHTPLALQESSVQGLPSSQLAFAWPLFSVPSQSLSAPSQISTAPG